MWYNYLFRQNSTSLHRLEPLGRPLRYFYGRASSNAERYEEYKSMPEPQKLRLDGTAVLPVLFLLIKSTTNYNISKDLSKMVSADVKANKNNKK